jgi:hypothetical protein
MVSLYDVSVPLFIRALRNLDAIIDKGAAWYVEQGKPESELTGARLIEDMQPFTYQIQRVSDTAKGLAVRVGGVANEAFADEEQTVAELKARIAKTIAFLEAAPREGFEGKEEAQIELVTPNRTLLFNGRDYVLNFAIPNFFFHMTTAYALLRKAGVPLGKPDFIGQVDSRPN